MSPRPPIAQYLPLTHLAYHLLLSLAEAPSHGYALAQRVRERSGGTVDPGTGSFYSVVRTLCDDKLIRPLPAPHRGRAAGAADSRRRCYEITPLGLDVLAAEARRLESLLVATRRLRLAGTPGAGRK